jgi:parvulin-like peptidyl-prolyl isomerase
MKIRLHFAALLLLAGIAQAQIVDRMVAVVNKGVILESELDQAARVESLLQGKPFDGLAPAEKSAVLERLIDRSLIDQQIMNPAMLDPSAEELAARVKEIREGIAGGTADERWQAVLAGYGITQLDLEEQLTAQARILRFIDLRFRVMVSVEKDAIAAYYQDKFLPEIRKRGVPEPKLADVSDKIEHVLMEQRIDDLLATWLQTLRAQAHIERMSPAAPRSASGATP